MDCICAGVITFNPDIERLTENVESVKQNGINSILIVDNGSNNINAIKELVKKKQLSLIENNDNYGVSKALNQIFSYCNEHSIKWVLTLDQDSVCPNNLGKEYFHYIDKNPEAEKIILCPIIKDRNSSLNESQARSSYVSVKRCITSGSLTSVNCWKALNGFDEYLFIDSVDWDFCDRAISQGFRIVQLTNVQLIHEIGNTVDHRFFFWKFPVLNHNSFRKYYRSRNLIYLAKKNGSIKCYVKNHLSVAKIIIIILLYEDKKREKLHAVIQGCIDAIKHDNSKAN